MNGSREGIGDADSALFDRLSTVLNASGDFKQDSANP